MDRTKEATQLARSELLTELLADWHAELIARFEQAQTAEEVLGCHIEIKALARLKDHLYAKLSAILKAASPASSRQNGARRADA